MARQLYQRDSTAFHLKASRRHIRLARKQKGAEKFADRIIPAQQKLIEKHNKTILADEKREDSYDDIMHADSRLDDSIRTTSENCDQYDRDHPGESVKLKLFPTGRFTDITELKYSEEPAEAERLAASIEILGNEHPLFPMVAELRSKIAEVNAAIEAYKAAITELTHAEVEEEAAKAELRQQYEFNYLDGRKELGAKYVERIFPVLTTHSKGVAASEAGQ